MTGRKYKTLNNVPYIIDRRGKPYLERGKVKRSTTEFYYTLQYWNGSYWAWADDSDTRSEAVSKIKQLTATIN